MGFGKNLDPSRVVGFLTGGIFFNGSTGLGWQNPAGFCPLPSLLLGPSTSESLKGENGSSSLFEGGMRGPVGARL
jgi:hypothetical protein